MWKDLIQRTPIIGSGYAFMEPLYTKIFGAIQRFVLSNKTWMVRGFFVVELFITLVIAGGAYMMLRIPGTVFFFIALARKLGTVSAGLLCLVVTPGILRRLGWLTLIRVPLMSVRRHLGILAYLTGMTHSIFIYWIPRLMFGARPLELYQLYGILALTVGLPLFLTSNDFSVRLLKKYWDVIHKGVYVMVLFASLHLLVQGRSTGFVLFGFVVLELISYIYSYSHHDHTVPRR